VTPRLRLALLCCVAPPLLTISATGCSAAGSQVTAAPASPSVEFVGQWGVHGQAPGQLDEPVGLAVDTVDRVYFADRGTGSVQKFTISGVPLLTFEDSAIRGAAGIAVDDGGAIYVADVRAGQIRVFFPEGDLLRVHRIAPQRHFEGPFIFSTGADGDIFVPDPAGGRIQVLTPRGQIKKTWSVASASATEQAHPVAVVAGPDGFIYVGDALSGRIYKFEAGGERMAVWNDSATAEPNAERFWGMAATADHLFVLRGGSPHLEIWTFDGRQESTDDLGGRLNTQPGSQTRTLALAISPGGELLVMDAAAPRVLRFRIHLGENR
jgi:sugar lactone lactonase YvrE